ncbi:MAG: LysE family translocator [Pseudonocardiaceae bacterium]|nr:LysE family translocator [Pseudonocardiaceae bacterium]
MVSNLPAFAIAALLMAMVPGPATAMLVRQSVRGGRRGAFATVAGIEAGVLFWAVAAAFGLAALLVASELAYQVLRVVGACVLVWLGIQALRSARKRAGATEAADISAPSRAASFRAGLLINLANPKLAVFAVSFLPQFIPAEQSGTGVFVLFALVFVLVDVVWYTLLAGVLGRLIGWLRREKVRRRLERLSGGVLIALGIRLALSDS